MDQRRVEDWPRSMLVGSAVKLLITGRAAGVVVGAAGAGGGGGGGGGVFFLQLAAKIANVSARVTAPVFVYDLVLLVIT
ncbi:MAG TPA: hypothetical protein VF146_18340, partial [Bryobacteraceae bacterium]